MDPARQFALQLANNPEQDTDSVVARAKAFHAFLTDADQDTAKDSAE